MDNDGNIINSITYDAFGEVTAETDPSVDFRKGYTGRELDEETGQHYYRSRYYDSSVGRFISEDTIGFAGGDANLYRYVGNSPLRYTDPYGEDWYDNANKVDQFLAGFGDAVTFGGTTLLREKLYGETATKNHEGGLFTAGQITGTVASTAAGFGTVDKLGKGVGLTQRVLQSYEVLGTGIGAYQATTNLMNGCGSALDLLNFSPALGAALSKLNKLNSEDLNRLIRSLNEEGGDANKILPGDLNADEIKELKRFVKKEAGTDILFKSREAKKEGNYFNWTTNEIHLKKGKTIQPRGMFLEEVQHALDDAKGHHEGFKNPWDEMYIGKKDPKPNLILHAGTFERMAENSKFKELGLINDSEAKKLKEKAQEWRRR